MNQPTVERIQEPPEGAGAKEIEQHLEQAREELGETVEALSRKLDVRANARQQLAAARSRSHELIGRVKSGARGTTGMVVGGVVAVTAGVAALVWKRRR